MGDGERGALGMTKSGKVYRNMGTRSHNMLELTDQCKLTHSHVHLFLGERGRNLFSPQDHELLCEGVAKAINIQREQSGNRGQDCLVSNLSTGCGHERYVAEVKDSTENGQDVLNLFWLHVHGVKRMPHLKRIEYYTSHT